MYTITGKNKLNNVLHTLRATKKSAEILDIGGTKYDLEFLNKAGFNNVLISNNSNKELADCRKTRINFDITKKTISKKFDVILFMDVLEHLVEPDLAIKNIKKMLKTNGIFIITTPNLANFFNRLFLLFGWSLPNYTPSDIKTGNPLTKAKSGSSFRNSFSHKSVFTQKQLIELMQFYGFNVIIKNGYHYGANQASEGGGNYGKIRNIFNSILPKSMKEGIFLVLKLNEAK